MCNYFDIKQLSEIWFSQCMITISIVFTLPFQLSITFQIIGGSPKFFSGHAVFPIHTFMPLNTLRPRQNGRHFADDIFNCIFSNENAWIPIKISLKFVPQGPNNNIPALVQIMACHRPGNKPLSGPMMVRLPMHICVTRPQWVNNGVFVLIKCKSLYSLLYLHQLAKPTFNSCHEWVIESA